MRRWLTRLKKSTKSAKTFSALALLRVSTWMNDRKEAASRKTLTALINAIVVRCRREIARAHKNEIISRQDKRENKREEAMPTVFLSSTSKDLVPYRQKADEAINRLDGYQCVQMENFGARDAAAEDFCPDLVAQCDLFVLLLGPSYGSRPPGSDKSYTELEYEAAVAFDKPRLIFASSEDFPIKQSLYDSLPADDKEKAKQFRQRAGAERIWKTFTTPDDLAVLISQAIPNWEKQRRSDEPVTLATYLDFIIQRNTYLDPRGVMQTRRSISLPLEEIFVTLKAEREVRRERFDLPTLLSGDTLETLEDSYERAFFDRSPRVETVDLAKAVREQSRVVFIGDPGAGKTTLMRFIALQFAKAMRDGQNVVTDKDGNDYGQTRLPIFVRVADYADAFKDDRNLRLLDFVLQASDNGTGVGVGDAWLGEGGRLGSSRSLKRKRCRFWRRWLSGYTANVRAAWPPKARSKISSHSFWPNDVAWPKIILTCHKPSKISCAVCANTPDCWSNVRRVFTASCT